MKICDLRSLRETEEDALCVLEDFCRKLVIIPSALDHTRSGIMPFFHDTAWEKRTSASAMQ